MSLFLREKYPLKITGQLFLNFRVTDLNTIMLLTINETKPTDVRLGIKKFENHILAVLLEERRAINS